MGFIVFSPLGARAPYDVTTTSVAQVQIWQELVMQRHLPCSHGNATPETASPWIDQAKTYYQDAWRSHWRSAGLLYYYSFLNLAKAYLSAEGVFACADLASTSLYHGLSNAPQRPSSITGFEISVHPPTSSNGQQNVFAHFYQTLVKAPWPFSDKVILRVTDFATYCSEMSDELVSLHSVNHAVCHARSILRVEGGNAWFEMLVSPVYADHILASVSDWTLTQVAPDAIDLRDRENWFHAFRVPANDFARLTLLRSSAVASEGKDASPALRKVQAEAFQHLGSFAFPTTTNISADPHWWFVPHVRFVEETLPWHPLLSEYLFAFVLSTILRYHPHLLSGDDKNSFLAEAWCNQCAIAALRHFLMVFTTPPKRINA